MLTAMPLLLVATVTFLRARDCARSKAYFSTRSAPRRENTFCCSTTSCSVPGHITPPMLVYSPSVFSRTT